MDNVYRICGAALISVVLSAVLKNRGSSIAPYLTEITGILILTSTISSLIPFVSFIKKLISDGAIEYDMVGTIIKAAVIAIICQLIYDICKENGENMLATVIEFTGNAEIILLSLPIVTSLLRDSFEAIKI